jgi:hypothetical protein
MDKALAERDLAIRRDNLDQSKAFWAASNLAPIALQRLSISAGASKFMLFGAGIIQKCGVSNKGERK